MFIISYFKKKQHSVTFGLYIFSIVLRPLIWKKKQIFLTEPLQIQYAWISYATKKLMLDLCKMLQKQSEAIHTFLWHF